MYDSVIIGAGPAGISAALYLKRANKNVLVLYHGESQLEKAHLIDNYYGFPGGISGKDLYNNGIKQAQNLGVEVKEEEVINLSFNGPLDFSIKTLNNEYKSKTIIIATGNKKLRPNIKGIVDFEGKGISYCAICDGFFYRKKKVAVIGNRNYALSEAEDLHNVTSDITILTNGESFDLKSEFPVDTRKIVEVGGEEKIQYVLFDDGSKMELNGIFIALGTAGGADFAKKLGVMMNKDSIEVNENMKTNINGIYACGNLTGGLLQVNKAVYEGALAGLDIVKYLKEQEV